MPRFASLVAIAALSATTLPAQDTTRPTVVSGTVRDAAGVPVVGAEVGLDKSRDVVISGDDGTFRLRGLPAGSHTIVVRRLGFEPMKTPVRVSAGVVQLDVRLKSVPVELVHVRSTAKHIGLTGFVQDTLGTSVGNATIRVYPGLPDPDTLRSHSVSRVDEDGSFFIPLAPGRYTLRVARASYPPATVQVSVPITGGRCVVVKLGLDDKKQGARCAVAR